MLKFKLLRVLMLTVLYNLESIHRVSYKTMIVFSKLHFHQLHLCLYVFSNYISNGSSRHHHLTTLEVFKT